MRMMLGDMQGNPSLLVKVEETNLESLEVWVVNGAWSGTFTPSKFADDEGIVLCHETGYSHPAKILSVNQDRLRGNYQDVFANWHNESYVAPEPRVLTYDDDDDIAF